MTPMMAAMMEQTTQALTAPAERVGCDCPKASVLEVSKVTMVMMAHTVTSQMMSKGFQPLSSSCSKSLNFCMMRFLLCLLRGKDTIILQTGQSYVTFDFFKNVIFAEKFNYAIDHPIGGTSAPNLT